MGPAKLSIIEMVSSVQGFIIHYVGNIWDSVSVHYREGVLWRGVSAIRGSTVLNTLCYSVPHEESRKIPEFAKMRDVTPNRCNTLVYAKWPPKTALVQEKVALVAVLTSKDAVRALR